MSNISNKISTTLVISLLILVSISCSKKWLDVNYNPDELTDSIATPDLILPDLLAGWPGLQVDAFNDWMGYWCRPQINEPGDQWTTYNFKGSFWVGAPKIGPSLLEDKSRKRGETFYEGIAKVIQALTWSRNVDMYNNLPYTEAFKENIRQPKYDSGQYIYEDVMKQLTKAIDLIKNAQMDKNIKISTADIMFHGDKTMWIKFINTLKLRLLIHQANRPERAEYIQKEIGEIVAEGTGFLNTGEDASMNPGYTRQEANPFYSEYTIFEPYTQYNWPPAWPSASANIIALNFLKENNDPRIGFFYEPVEKQVPAGGAEPFTQPAPLEYRGNKFGLSINEAEYPYQGTAYVSHIGGIAEDGVVTPASTGILKGYDMDRWVLTSIESLFLQAEAIYRGWLPGDPEQAYKDAVKESFRWLNVGGNSTMPELSDAVFNDWYNEQVAADNPHVSWAAAPDKYKLLMFQKYLALDGIESFETYVDYRRNGAYPDIPLSADPKRVSDKLPIRDLYPAGEYVNNAENVNAQGKIDVFNSKIWWMP